MSGMQTVGVMLTEEEFRLFRSLIYEKSGIFLKEAKRDFLESRLAKRMQATNMTTPYWYYRFVTNNGNQELPELLDSLTINETAFFRNMPQFELFRKTVLAGLAAKSEGAGRKQMRIWSAGSSTGEEAYSIAMTVLDTLPGAADWNITIFASDISMKSLDLAHKGLYPAAKVRENVPEKFATRYFEDCGGHMRVRGEVRKMVVFDYHNLKHENGLADLDVVFCRNVMIYFDDQEQKRLVNKFHRSLNPGGYLLLGHSESLYGWNTGFRFLYDGKGTAYQKAEGATAP